MSAKSAASLSKRLQSHFTLQTVLGIAASQCWLMYSSICLLYSRKVPEFGYATPPKISSIGNRMLHCQYIDPPNLCSVRDNNMPHGFTGPETSSLPKCRSHSACLGPYTPSSRLYTWMPSKDIIVDWKSPEHILQKCIYQRPSLQFLTS